METDTMGRVLVEAMLESLKDLWALEQGLIKPIRCEGLLCLMPWLIPARQCFLCLLA